MLCVEFVFLVLRKEGGICLEGGEGFYVGLGG